MVRVEFAPEVFADFDRIFDQAAARGPVGATVVIDEIVAALRLLATSPLIGRRVAGGKRELVIGRGARGLVALYRYVPQAEAVFVLAVRSQREAGYKHG